MKQDHNYVTLDACRTKEDIAYLRRWFDDASGYYGGVLYDEKKIAIGDFALDSWEKMEKAFPDFKFDYGD